MSSKSAPSQDHHHSLKRLVIADTKLRLIIALAKYDERIVVHEEFQGPGTARRSRVGQIDKFEMGAEGIGQELA